MNISKNINKVITKSANNLSNLNNWELRLILGCSALATKPLVDCYVNRKLDAETRKCSALKAAAKIIVGTVLGVAARALGEKLIGPWYGIPKIASACTAVLSVLTFGKVCTSKSLNIISGWIDPKCKGEKSANKQNVRRDA